jgi:hypothetical protein
MLPIEHLVWELPLTFWPSCQHDQLASRQDRSKTPVADEFIMCCPLNTQMLIDDDDNNDDDDEHPAILNIF